MKTAAILLVAVTLSTSLFLQSSAAPDPYFARALTSLGDLVNGLGDTTSTTLNGVGTILDETIGALVGKGGKTCVAYLLFLKDLGLVLKAAQERLFGLLTDVTKGLDEATANASGALKELLAKLNALLKVLLKELPELLKALVAAVANPTKENLNKVDALLQKLERIVDKLTEALTEDTAGTLTFITKSLMIAIINATKDGMGAIEVVTTSLRRNQGD